MLNSELTNSGFPQVALDYIRSIESAVAAVQQGTPTFHLFPEGLPGFERSRVTRYLESEHGFTVETTPTGLSVSVSPPDA